MMVRRHINWNRWTAQGRVILSRNIKFTLNTFLKTKHAKHILRLWVNNDWQLPVGFLHFSANQTANKRLKWFLIGEAMKKKPLDVKK